MGPGVIARGAPVLIVAFALLIGSATTMAEPALVAIGEQAQDVSSGRIGASGIRVVVAVGVAVGAYRILVGAWFQYFIMAAYAIVLVLVVPRYIIALAFGLAGATTSAVTVPLVTALGTGLATETEGRDPLIDGFGLIAFASVFSIIAVLLYAMVLDYFPRLRRQWS